MKSLTYAIPGDAPVAHSGMIHTEVFAEMGPG